MTRARKATVFEQGDFLGGCDGFIFERNDLIVGYCAWKVEAEVFKVGTVRFDREQVDRKEVVRVLGMAVRRKAKALGFDSMLWTYDNPSDETIGWAAEYLTTGKVELASMTLKYKF